MNYYFDDDDVDVDVDDDDDDDDDDLLTEYPYKGIALKFTVGHPTEGLFVYCCEIELE